MLGEYDSINLDNQQVLVIFACYTTVREGIHNPNRRIIEGKREMGLEMI